MSEDVKNTHRPFKIAIERSDGLVQITFLLIELTATQFPINIKFKCHLTGEVLDATLMGVSKKTEVPVFKQFKPEEVVK